MAQHPNISYSLIFLFLEFHDLNHMIQCNKQCYNIVKSCTFFCNTYNPRKTFYFGGHIANHSDGLHFLSQCNQSSILIQFIQELKPSNIRHITTPKLELLLQLKTIKELKLNEICGPFFYKNSTFQPEHIFNHLAPTLVKLELAIHQGQFGNTRNLDSLRVCKNITHLTINFFNHTPNHFSFDFLASLEQITSLHINDDLNGRGFDANVLNSFTQNAKQLKQLQYLHFNQGLKHSKDSLLFLRQFCDQNPIISTQNLKELRGLRYLNVQDLPEIKLLLDPFPNLESIDLHFIQQTFTSETIENITRMPFVTELIITWCNFSNLILEQLIQTITRQIKSLTLHFSPYCGYGSTTMKIDLHSTIAHCTKLEHLKLYNILLKESNEMKSLHNLKELKSMHFSNDWTWKYLLKLEEVYLNDSKLDIFRIPSLVFPKLESCNFERNGFKFIYNIK
jgi:hypothetical protein